MPATLRLDALGDLRLALDTQPLAQRLPLKCQALLCYLAVTARAHPRSALATLFWGDSSDDDAAASLRKALSTLHHALAPYLLITRQTVAFNRASPYVLDVEHFVTACDRGAADQEALRTAIELYRGDFLQDFPLHDSPIFDAWMLAVRERLREQVLQALDLLSNRHAARGEDMDAISWLRHLLQLDPWREEGHRQLMLLLQRNGQTSAALQQYATCRRLLQDELGVEPSSETTELYQRIVASQADRRPQIVLPATTFVGREPERTMLRQLLADPNCRLITILGQGGVGKSRLALQVAADHEQRFMHGACTALLAAATSGDLLVSAIAGALGLTFDRQLAPATQLVDYLREKDVLLVLDNFEQLIDAGADLIATFVAQAPQVKLLVTSRERLNLQEEWLLELDGLPVPSEATGKTDEEDRESPAIQLFVDRTRRIQPGFVPSGAEAECLLAICRLVDGLPLAIELAASAMRSFTCAEIAREIEHNHDFLLTSVRNVPERQRSMRATFEYSWKLLAPPEQDVYRRLSVFRGGFEREAAANVAGATAALLQALADKSLLRRDRTGRYDLHELLRQYAEEKLLLLSAEHVVMRDRHARYIAGFLARQVELLRGPRQRVSLDAIGTEIENVRSGWQWAIERTDVAAIDDALEGCYQFYEMRSHFQEGVDVFAAAIARLEEARSIDLGATERPGIVDRLRARQAVLLHRLGRYEQARELLIRSLASTRQRDDQREIAFCLNSLGYVDYDLGDYTEGRRRFEESLAIYRQIGDLWGMAGTLTNLGLIGTVQERIAVLREGIDVCRTAGDQRTLARILNNLGGLITDDGRYTEAKAMFAESLAIFEDIGYRRGAAYVLYQLSALYSYIGAYEEGWEYGQRSLALFHQIGERRGIAICHSSLGTLATHLGKYEQARQILQDGLAICHELGDQYLQIYGLDQLGVIAQACGAIAEALEHHRAALAIAHEIGDQATVATVLANLARATALAGDPRQARLSFFEALAIAMEQQAYSVALEVIYGLAVLLQDEAPEQAVEQLSFVVEHPASFYDTRNEAHQLLDQIMSRLPPELAAAALEQGRASTLETVSARLLKQVPNGTTETRRTN